MVPTPASSRCSSSFSTLTAASVISSLSQKPSRRSPRSAIKMTLCFLPCLPASAFRASNTSISLFSESSVSLTTSSISLSIGILISINGFSMPKSFASCSCSNLDEAIYLTPPSANCLTHCGMPVVPLMTPATSIPFSAHLPTTYSTLCFK